MLTQNTSYRYQLPKKASKGNCPQCGPRHRKTLSRYIDTRTGEALPEPYGRCDRENNCGYHLSPYHKNSSGRSYVDEQNQSQRSNPPLPKLWFRLAVNQKRNGINATSFIKCLMEMEGATLEQAERVADYVFNKTRKATLSRQSSVVYTIPDELFNASIGYYEQNQFARLLRAQIGANAAYELMKKFQIGTSSYWPGACVFWYIDEEGRKRGGQIKLFGDDWHTVKYVDREGKKRSKTSWVHSALLRRYKQQQRPFPDWLTEYEQKAERSPCLFGLPQLLTAPSDMPIAIVEAPKTAVICTHYLPGFIWMAVGALSYLNTYRLAPLRGRKIKLYPDLNAHIDWSRRAEQLQAMGFSIEVSDLLERVANDEQKANGLDIADFILNSTLYVRSIAEQLSQPNSILRPCESQIERLIVSPCIEYPKEWDK